MSQTSYAPTLTAGGHITIPKATKASKNRKPFECLYCHIVITVDGEQSWNSHVFQDLQPYVCVMSTCHIPDRLYATRREWLHHLETAHADGMPRAGRDTVTGNDTHCPLCLERGLSGKTYGRHVARHLQEIALFILPPCNDDVDADEEGAKSVGTLDLDYDFHPDSDESQPGRYKEGSELQQPRIPMMPVEKYSSYPKLAFQEALALLDQGRPFPHSYLFNQLRHRRHVSVGMVVLTNSNVRV